MKILLFGKNGQVGWELQRSLAPLGELVAVDFDTPGDLSGDFTDPAALAETVRRVAPRVIVNAAAYTAVDQAEAEPELARAINAGAPAVLAKAAEKLGAWLVHYSTDYVFDGQGEAPRVETDPTGPLSVYGQTKLEGELAVARAPKHFILRTSWVYAARGANFAKTMLRLAAERDLLRVIDDQVGAPTGADLLADVTAHVLRAAEDRPQLAGLYHLAAADETSWHGYACFVIEEARRAGHALRVAADRVESIPSSAYPTPARRPANSRLDTGKLRRTFGVHLPDWRVGVKRLIDELPVNQGDEHTGS
ncbi:MAG: dTDP-4-dehydrorhamnose reductase [Candidatus Accumulibacter sp.]|jgi:dTDP-4-dehydrorhamnose reductase|nr:dTDP-4-dehydrorhamnose reductase [Accumulibacter sp.]